MTKRILAGAQAYGYGPASKLVSIVSQLQDYDNLAIDFWGSGVAETFARLNSSLFSEIYTELPDPADYVAVIGVMDPLIAAWGYVNNIPVFSADSLYWRWIWPPEEREEVLSAIEEYSCCGDHEALLAYMARYPHEMRQFIAHAMSAHSFHQWYPGKGRTDNAAEQLNVTEVSPIVDTRFRTSAKRDTVLITFSGMITPAVTFEDLIVYLRLVHQLIEPALENLLTHYQVICATNPTMHAVARAIWPEEVDIKALSQQEMLETINHSAIVLMPMGITTAFECFAYETPFFVLPEQSHGHYPNHRQLVDLAGGEELFRAHFPDALLHYHFGYEVPVPPSGVSGMFLLYRQILRGKERELLASMQGVLSGALRKVMEYGSAGWWQRQRGVLKKLNRDFTGGLEIKTAIAADLGLD